MPGQKVLTTPRSALQLMLVAALLGWPVCKLNNPWHAFTYRRVIDAPSTCDCVCVWVGGGCTLCFSTPGVIVRWCVGQQRGHLLLVRVAAGGAPWLAAQVQMQVQQVAPPAVQQAAAAQQQLHQQQMAAQLAAHQQQMAAQLAAQLATHQQQMATQQTAHQQAVTTQLATHQQQVTTQLATHQQAVTTQLATAIAPVIAGVANSRAEATNARATGHPARVLRPLSKEEPGTAGLPGVAQPIGTQPAAANVPFPHTLGTLHHLTTAQLTALETFYGKRFPGANLNQRRMAFAEYIGVLP